MKPLPSSKTTQTKKTGWAGEIFNTRSQIESLQNPLPQVVGKMESEREAAEIALESNCYHSAVVNRHNSRLKSHKKELKDTK